MFRHLDAREIVPTIEQHFDDQVALQPVTEIDNLTTGLSRKIWQKVMILDTLGSGSG